MCVVVPCTNYNLVLLDNFLNFILSLSNRLKHRYKYAYTALTTCPHYHDAYACLKY